jgi:hypothetical protein
LTSLHVSTAQRLPVLHSDAAVVTAAILTQPGEVLIENPFDLTNISAWWEEEVHDREGNIRK